MNDNHPLRRIGRDPTAFEAFYRANVEAVQRFIARRVNDPHLAADLTADVFLAVIEEAPAAGGPPSEANAFKSSVGSGGFSMTIPKNMIQPGQTLVLESVWPDSQSWMVKVAIANGPVGACHLVDADPRFMPAGPAPAGGSNGVEPTAVATAQ